MAETKFNEMSGTKVALLLVASLLAATAIAEGVKYAWNQRNVGS